MPNAARFLVLAAVVAMTAALVWFSRRGADVAPDGGRTDPPAPVTATPGIPAATGNPSTAGPPPYTPVAAATTAVEGYIAFPDHSWYPPLNGVTKAPPIVFHRLAPFAKVVGKTTDPSGREWYVHENGTRSTTILGKDGTPIGLVDQEMPVQPQVNDDPPLVK